MEFGGRPSPEDHARLCQFLLVALLLPGPASRVPDLVILDFNVPGVEGASVLNGIRGNSRWAHAGVFMFTASQNPADIARVKMLGADDYLIKPVDVAGFEKFGRAIGEWLEQRAPAKKKGNPGEPE